MAAHVHTPSGVVLEMPYFVGVGLGMIPTQTRVAALGHNPNIAAGAAADVTEPGGNINWLAAAATLQVSSTSVNDTASGTGGRTALIGGINSAGAAVTEIVTFNGMTPVLTVNQYRRINTFVLLTAGTSDVNEGDITLEVAGGGSIQNIMRAGYGFGRTCSYSVPTGFTLFIRSFVFTVLAANGSGVNVATFGFFFKRTNGAYRIPLEFQVSSSSPYRHTADEGVMVAAGEDFCIRVTNAGQNNTNVTAAFEGILIKNSALL